MFEREVKFIYDFNSNKVKKLGSTATFTELLPLGIHPAILQYISAEVEYRVFEDRQTLLKHSMFDYSGAEISKHFNKIAVEIKKEKRFSTDFLSKVILHATSFNVNYLIRPNWSLKKLIFDTSESNSVEEINQILNYTYFYKHITKVVRNYLDKKKLITLNKDEFSELLINFDKVSMHSYGKDIIETAVKSMASFFNIGSMNQKSVPLQGIGIFLQEKKMISHLEMLQRKLGTETKNKIEVSDLMSLLLSIPIDNVDYVEPAEAEEKVKFDDISEPTKTEKIEDEPPFVDEIEEEKPEEEIFEEPTEDEEIIDDDIEIKLRSNKEKAVAEIEDEDIEQEEDEEIDEAIEDEYEDPAEYIVDQMDAGAEIILTAEDVEEIETDEVDDFAETVEKMNDNDDEILEEATNDIEKDENEPERNEEITSDEKNDFEELEFDEDDETEELVIEEDATEVLEFDEPEETDELVIEEEVEYEMPPEADDEYSYPDRDKVETEDEVDKSEELNDDETSENTEEKKEEVTESDNVDDDEDEIIPQTTLFGDLPNLGTDDQSEKDEFVAEFGAQNYPKRIDISDLLENRNMTKIIEVVFDYDMEEFANAIEKICDSSSSHEAFGTLQEIFELNQVNPTSKEAQAFRDIISEYFDQS